MTETYTHEAQILAWPPTREVAKVLSMSIREDTGWMPRFTGTVECVTTPELLSDNPPEYLTLRMSRIEGHGFTLAQWSDKWQGHVDQMTAEGITSPADITAALGSTSTAAPAESLQITMLARRYVNDLAQGVTTIELTSCEMKLGDLKYLSEPQYGTPDPNTMIRERLDRMFLKGTPADAIVRELIGDSQTAYLSMTPLVRKNIRDDITFPIGASVLDPIHEALTDLDMILWAERPDQYMMRNRATSATTHTLTPSTGLISAEHVNDLGEASATASMRLVESPSNSHVDAYYYGDAPGYRVGEFTEQKKRNRVEDRPPGTYPHYSANRPRTSSRKHLVHAVAISHYQYRADHKARLTIPGVVDKLGAISTVTYKYPEGLAELEIESATNWTT